MDRLQRFAGQFAPLQQQQQQLQFQAVHHQHADRKYECIQVEQQGRVALIRLHRPAALNALNDQIIAELSEAVHGFNACPDTGCLVITGSGDKAFAAGADIKEMKDEGFARMLATDKFGALERSLGASRLPVIAAVNGFALGGGCELAMMCDVILASERAVFGQPEIKIGTIPGAGGTQRLVRLVGKSKAMELVLSGRQLRAQEALQFGLVAAVHPAEKLLPEALKLAQEIAGLSAPVVRLAKEAVNAADNTALLQGVQLEKRLFQSTFALDDRREGMSAFAEKRKPVWMHQ